MSWKRKVRGGLMAFVGFMLSPLSWWNDLFVNVPIAVGVGWLIGWFYAPAFKPAVVVAYWLTNVLGFVLMHKGAQQALSADGGKGYSKRELIRDLCVSLGYTLLILALFQLKVLQPVSSYFERHR